MVVSGLECYLDDVWSHNTTLRCTKLKCGFILVVDGLWLTKIDSEQSRAWWSLLVLVSWLITTM